MIIPLTQLKPSGLREDYLFKRVEAKVKQDVFGSICLGFDFWEEFEFFELTINMRQQGDLQFAAMLNRIRIGKTSKDDIDLVYKRLLKLDNKKSFIVNAVEHYFELLNENPEMISLFANNKLVDDFNSLCNRVLKINTVEVEAIDVNPGNRLNFRPNNYKPKIRKLKQSLKPISINKTAGLASKLSIGVGSRIILRKNLNTDIGLVNGVMGTLKSNRSFKN